MSTAHATHTPPYHQPDATHQTSRIPEAGLHRQPSTSTSTRQPSSRHANVPPVQHIPPQPTAVPAPPPPQPHTHQRAHPAAAAAAAAPNGPANPPQAYAAPAAAAAAANAGQPTATQHLQPRRRTMLTSTSGDWALGKTIGAGSMGKVKLAKHMVTGEQVAVKIIPRYSTEDYRNPRDMERADRSKEIRTAREAAIVTLLHHPYVCGMRDVVRTNYHWYMLFEYVNGGQMLDYIISHGKLKEKQARKFARQVASALDYCHRNSIVHRDLKIENILISKTGDIKIIDFGLSNLFNPISKLKTFCGSLYFAAPELLQARQYTGPEIDVWSFGVVLYVLVCGKVPFDDQSMPQLHAKIKKGQTEYPPSLTADCRHLISRMLVTDPTQRATLHEVMNHPWMTKGYNAPPENYLPIREPLQLPLDQEIIHMMTGFDFGPPDLITQQLTKVLDSEDYQSALRSHLAQTAAGPAVTPTPSAAAETKRKSVFDFYKRRNSNSKDTLSASASSLEALPAGTDPLNAFNPLISVYHLVKEKRDRDRAAASAALVASANGSAASMPGAPTLPRSPGEQPLRMAGNGSGNASGTGNGNGNAPPETAAAARSPIKEPQSARVRPSGYAEGDRDPQGAARSRPRARTQGEEEAMHPGHQQQTLPIHTRNAVNETAPLPAQQPQEVQQQPPPQPQPKKENAAVGLLRRFSTRKKLRVQTQTQQPPQPPQQQVPENPMSPPPQVNVQAAAEDTITPPRRSFGVRRSGWRGREKERDVSPSSANSGGSGGGLAGQQQGQQQTQQAQVAKGEPQSAGPAGPPTGQPDFLSPPTGTAPPPSRSSGMRLGRSVSVSSADHRARRGGLKKPVETAPQQQQPAAVQEGEAADNDSALRARSTDTNSASMPASEPASATAAPAAPSTSANANAATKAGMPRRAHTFRARSLGHARRDSLQLRRSRRSEANAREADLPEETSTDVEGQGSRRGMLRRADSKAAADGGAGGGQAGGNVGGNGSGSPGGSPSNTNEDLAKPVYLKGLFSVSTTSTKSFAFIRADIKRVLTQLGVEFADVKGGFSCRKVPSIDLVQQPGRGNPPAGQQAGEAQQAQGQGHKHRISFAGFGNGGATDLKHSRSLHRRHHAGPPDRSFVSGSEGSEEFVGATAPPVNTGANNGTNTGQAAETTTRIRDDKNGNLILRFEVLIVKVPLFSLHGIQFKKVAGGMWQYREMAKKILDELRL